MSPMSVLTDSPLWTIAGVESAPTQPSPSPVQRLTAATVVTETAAV